MVPTVKKLAVMPFPGMYLSGVSVNTFTAVEREVVTDLWCQSLSPLVMVLHLKIE
jgi:hypothetical protein